MKKVLAIVLSLMILFSAGMFAAAEEDHEVFPEDPVTEETSKEAAPDEETEVSPEASAVEEEPEGPIEISTAEELKEIADRLSADYILTADIDLEGKEWIPLGTYIPSGEEEEEQVTPSQRYAFTGTFDGNGHTIYNLVIRQPEGIALGLFGCIANASIGNFTLENATVEGTVMAADAVGYSFRSTVYNVQRYCLQLCLRMFPRRLSLSFA